MSDYQRLEESERADLNHQPMTKESYEALSPFHQGYVSYMQGAWPNAVIPDSNPHPVGTTEAEQWSHGNFKAMLDTQDSEE